MIPLVFSQILQKTLCSLWTVPPVYGFIIANKMTYLYNIHPRNSIFIDTT